MFNFHFRQISKLLILKILELVEMSMTHRNHYSWLLTHKFIQKKSRKFHYHFRKILFWKISKSQKMKTLEKTRADKSLRSVLIKSWEPWIWDQYLSKTMRESRISLYVRVGENIEHEIKYSLYVRVGEAKSFGIAVREPPSSIRDICLFMVSCRLSWVWEECELVLKGNKKRIGTSCMCAKLEAQGS